jgi:quinolinate synthase
MEIVAMPSVDNTIQLIQLGKQGVASVCDPALSEDPWNFDQRLGYGPGASEWDRIPASAPRQGALPDVYRTASAEELDLRIRAAKRALGERVVVLGHFYQRDEVVKYADFVGDSYQLAQAARTRPMAEAIVFCGVHFMAETADIVSGPSQKVILPNLAAGCSMADMADEDSVEECWATLAGLFGTAPDAEGKVPVIPVTYMNSSAALKAFCGRHGGIVCTSSNADVVLRWAFERDSACSSFRINTWEGIRRKRWAYLWSRCPSGTRASRSAGPMRRLCALRASSSGTVIAACINALRWSRLRTRGRTIQMCE